VSANPTYAVTTGTGKPRLIREMAAAIFTSSASTTFDTNTVVDASAISTDIQLGMRVSATRRVNTGGQDFDYLSYGKVTQIDIVLKKLWVDSWVGGVPTNGIVYKVDGWIADLPRTLEKGIEESCTQLKRVIKMYRNNLSVRLYGFSYSAVLDFEKRFTPDAMFEMRGIFQQDLDGDSQRLFLIPRVDKPGFNYEVFIDDDINAVLHPSGDFHSGIKLRFRGKRPLASLPWAQFGGYGFNFGRDFGIGL